MDVAAVRAHIEQNPLIWASYGVGVVLLSVLTFRSYRGLRAAERRLVEVNRMYIQNGGKLGRRGNEPQGVPLTASEVAAQERAQFPSVQLPDTHRTPPPASGGGAAA